MHIFTDLYEVESCKTLFTETFNNNKRKREVVEIEIESAFVKDGYRWVKNTS
jgi:hypothetical protein